MLQRYWRAETGIFLVLWLVLLVGARSRLFRDPGTFWHTVVGQRILATRTFPETDSFSHPFGGELWVPIEWLGECAMALVHGLDGFDSLLLATATVLAALHTWIASRLTRAGLHWSLTATFLALSLAASSSNWHVRPHLATMVLLPVTFAALCDFEQGRIGLRRLFGLVPLFVLWTNLHGGMLGGLGTLALAVIYWSVSWCVGRGSPHIGGRQLLCLGGLSVACGLTAFVNPYGAEVPRIWYRLMASPVLPEIIVEHAPLKATSLDGMAVLVFGAVYGFMLLGLRRQWPRFAYLLPLVWLLLASTRIRHAPLFSLTTLVALAEVLPHTRWTTWLASPGRDLFCFDAQASRGREPPVSWRSFLPARSNRGLTPPARLLIIPTSVVALAFILQCASLRVPVIGHDWARLDPSYWPVDLLPELCAEASRQPPGTPIFNEVLDGGFLIYHTPRLRVFADDRCELYGDQWLLTLLAAEWSDTEPRLHSLLRGRGPFDLALTRTGSGYDHHFRAAKEWELVRETEPATLYRRRTKSSEPPATPSGAIVKH